MGREPGSAARPKTSQGILSSTQTHRHRSTTHIRTAYLPLALAVGFGGFSGSVPSLSLGQMFSQRKWSASMESARWLTSLSAFHIHSVAGLAEKRTFSEMSSRICRGGDGSSGSAFSSTTGSSPSSGGGGGSLTSSMGGISPGMNASGRFQVSTNIARSSGHASPSASSQNLPSSSVMMCTGGYVGQRCVSIGFHGRGGAVRTRRMTGRVPTVKKYIIPDEEQVRGTHVTRLRRRA